MGNKGFVLMFMVKCLECGEDFRVIHWSHLKLHNMTMADYYNKYPGAPVSSSEYRSGLSESQRASWINPYRKEATSKRISERNKRWWRENPSFVTNVKRRVSDSVRALWEGPFREYKTKRAAIQATAQNADPNSKFGGRSEYWTKELRRSASRRAVLRNLDPNDKFKSGKYVRRPCQYSGPKGNIIMRSSWEVRFARDLDNLGLDWQYEKHRFMYMIESDAHYYIPDFFIPVYNLFVEVKPYYAIDSWVISKCDSISAPYDILLVCEHNWEEILVEIKSLEEYAG